MCEYVKHLKVTARVETNTVLTIREEITKNKRADKISKYTWRLRSGPNRKPIRLAEPTSASVPPLPSPQAGRFLAQPCPGVNHIGVIRIMCA